MGDSNGPPSAGAVGSAARRGTETPAKTPRRLAPVACLLAGLLGAISAATPWWTTSTSSSGTSSMAEFYPGGDLYAGGGGGGGYTSYANAGIASIGDLYAVVLAGTIAIALVGWALTAFAIGRSRGRWGGPRYRRFVRPAHFVAVGVGVLLAVTVPVVQPELYRTANPGGACTSAAPPGACTSFWGTTHGVGATVLWGAGLGWWMDVAAAALLALALLFETVVAAKAPRTGRYPE